MSRLAPLRFKTLVSRLRKHDKRFEFYADRGKGSHRMIYHPDILGRPVSFPLKCHGANPQIAVHYLRDLIRAFKLPEGVL